MTTRNFTETRQTVLGLNLNIDRVETLRLKRYQKSWDFYLGKQWDVAPQTGEPQVTVNYAKMVVDMGWFYLLSKRPRINRRTREGESKEETQRILEFLRDVWYVHNDGDLTRMDTGLSGGITGDAFVVVSVLEKEFGGGETRPLPEDEKRILIEIHDSALVFPKFSFKPFGELIEVELWHPWVVQAQQQEPTMTDTHLDPSPVTNEEVHVFREIVTKHTIREFIDDHEITKPEVHYGESFLGSRKNPLGVINVVHIPNQRIPREFFGMSDLQDVADLNKELNQQLSEVADILNYHASPVTIVKGARVSELQRGVNKVWGGIPEKGDVKNLEMVGDLAGSHRFFEEMRLATLETARTPEIATGRHFPASNLSGTALSMLYGPLIERAARKAPTYIRGIQRINELILRIGELKFSSELGKISRKGLAKYQTNVTLPSAIPRNEKEDLDIAEQKLTLKLTSRQRIWDELGVEDQESLEKEIEEDIEAGVVPEDFKSAKPPPSSDDTKPPKDPKPGSGRPPKGGSKE